MLALEERLTLTKSYISCLERDTILEEIYWTLKYFPECMSHNFAFWFDQPKEPPVHMQ